ncbi:MAG TPA: short-chain dehydrogenase [Rikenellaceae bacterium]|nr:short-chain dehydrogenase [Rikenellaceae bacterium]
MIGFKEKYGKTALIAGASEGIGAAFANSLAAKGMDLILIARRPEPLHKLAEEIETVYKINVTIISCDLSMPNAVDIIEDELKGKEVDLLVYNAALSYIGPFADSSAENNSRITQVNMLTSLNMLNHFGCKMVARGRGAVVLMSSLAGFQGSGFLAVYAATKAFNRILGESLWYEWKNKGVDVIACCAGATSTPGYLDSNPDKKNLFAPRVQAPCEVSSECLKRIGKTPSFITGRGNRFASFVMQKLMPRKLAIKIMGDTTREMYRINF